MMVTIPLRANRWLARLGVMENGLEHLAEGLPASEITIAEALKQAGYATGMVGKWHLGDFNAQLHHHPLEHGFDFYAGVPCSNDMFPYSYWKNDDVVEEDLGLRQEGLTSELTREAIAFIEANRSRPFFLYFAHKNVHTPLFPSPEFAGRSAADPYGDSVEEFDASVGGIVRALADRGLLDRTLLFVTSDNGPWHLGNPGALRGRKGQPMEGGQRVPAGGVIDAPAMNIDLFPTFLELAGAELPRDRVIDGRSLQGLLFDVEADSNESYDVIERHPEQAARLHAAIEAWEREFFDNPRGWK